MITLIPEGTRGLPLGVSVEIETRYDSTHVIICSRLHGTKRFELPHCYSNDFSAHEILRNSDFLKYLSRYR